MQSPAQHGLTFPGHALLIAAVIFLLLKPVHARDPGELNQALGYDKTARLLILNHDDVGMNFETNQAYLENVKNTNQASATVMVPCPWFAHIAHKAIQDNIPLGIHLTLTSEWINYRWSPVTSRNLVPSLVDDHGYFYPDINRLFNNADLAQVRMEVTAQIERALEFNIDITHLDSHMGSMHLHPDYFDIFLSLAATYQLPIRMGSTDDLNRIFGHSKMRKQADAKGILYPDYLVYQGPEKNESRAQYWTRHLKQLKPGITEIYTHAAVPSEGLKATSNRWHDRVDDYRFFVSEDAFRSLLKQLQIHLISYKALRQLQRTKQ